MAERISLADLVLEERLAEPAVVAAAVRRAREGVPLALALSDAGVPEVGLAAALRRRLGLPVVELANEPVDPEALAEVTAELAARHLCIPLEVGESHGRKVLRLAMANPLDLDAVHDVAFATAARIDVVIAMPSAVLEALANRYRMSVTKVLRVEAPAPSQDDPTSPGRAAVPPPHTQPYHRVADEASVELRLRALLNLLVDRGLLDEDAYHEEVRRLMKDAAR